MARPKSDHVLRKERAQRLFNDPETINLICTRVAGGGSLTDLCEIWDIPFGWVAAWLREDRDRSKRYTQATVDHADWLKERVVAELKAIGFADLRKLYNENGELLNPKDWPVEVARAVAGVDASELFEDGERVGVLKKVKTIDKTKALQLLGQTYGGYTQKHEHGGAVTLVELVAAANKTDEEE